MHSGRNYTIKEVLRWTRRDIYTLLLISAVPTFCYEVLGWTWLIVPWLPIALIGTAVAFIVGFKNNMSYDRMWEGRRAWGAIVNASRAWGIMSKDYVTNRHAVSPLAPEDLKKVQQQLVHRHFAWLTALRYALRESRVWESSHLPHNAEYRVFFNVAEHKGDLAEQLSKYLSPEERDYVLSKKNKAAQVVSLQSTHLRSLLEQGLIEDFRHMEMERLLVEFYTQQGVCERLKNFPYPRQFATLNLYFIWLFVLMVPFGMIQEFQKLGDHYVWLTIPFSALVSWIFTMMERIGEATENPFEGSANDVPITAMSRTIEIDLREMLDETDIPPALQPVNHILL